ncbi:trans-sialidase [Trypanosoma cruzi]|nr:trans-sialidase [Trypanosoma cruzi]
MLSRAAAVKAPRTDNRRRVTGSSGRRREGREGEPQSPNMSRRVFTFAVSLLFLVMCCGSGGAAAASMGGIKCLRGCRGWPLFLFRDERIWNRRVGLVKVEGGIRLDRSLLWVLVE